jgi:hypothetical protein
MRTTLDLGDDVVAAARAMCAASGGSLGRAVTELARVGLNAPTTGLDGFPTFPLVEGHVITTDMIVEHRD